MKHILIAVFALSVACGGANQVMDTVETTTEKLQPIADSFQAVCITARTCLEAAGQDVTEVERVCREGWDAFKIIKAIQDTTVRAVGGEPE